MVKCDKNKKARIAARNLRKQGHTYEEIKGVIKVARALAGRRGGGTGSGGQQYSTLNTSNTLKNSLKHPEHP